MEQQHLSNATAKFLFVPVDGLQSRSRNDSKPESQKYLTAARKHVMTGVKESRKSARRNRTRSGASDDLAVAQRARDRVVVTCEKVQASLDICDSIDPSLLLCGSVWSEDSRFDLSAFTPTAYGRSSMSPLGDTRLDPFTRWPATVTDRMRYLLDHLLITTCESVRPLRAVTWTLLSQDPGIFFHGLAISAFCLSSRYRTTKRTALISEGLTYYAKGLKSVNDRLGTKSEGRSDGMVVSILGMAVHALSAPHANGWCWETAPSKLTRCRENNDQFLPHFRALRTILNQRGGVECVAANRELRHFLFIMDVEGALSRDARPFFEIPTYIHEQFHAMCAQPSALANRCISSWVSEFPSISTAIHIFHDLACIVSWLSCQIGGMKSSQRDFEMDSCYLLPLVHRCLQLSETVFYEDPFANLDVLSRPEQAFQDALRHSIILSLSPLRRRLGLQALGTDIHLTRSISALHRCLVDHYNLNLQQMVFWMLVVGAMEACSLGRDSGWFFPRILDACALIGAKAFEDVRATVKHAVVQLIWLEEVMDQTLDHMLESLRKFMLTPDFVA